MRSCCCRDSPSCALSMAMPITTRRLRQTLVVLSASACNHWSIRVGSACYPLFPYRWLEGSIVKQYTTRKRWMYAGAWRLDLRYSEAMVVQHRRMGLFDEGDEMLAAVDLWATASPWMENGVLLPSPIQLHPHNCSPNALRSV